jgi:hypothetical protein
VRLAIPHRYRFGRDRLVVGRELAGERAWDALRLESDGPFALPATRADWEARAADPLVAARAAALHRHLGDARAVASYGVGTAVTELALARLAPGRRLVVTEFAPETVERLVGLFPEAEVVRHDLRRDLPVEGIDAHVLHRVDTELDDAGFEGLLRRFRSVTLIVVATELLGLRPFARELVTLARGGSTRAGLVRSRGAFESLWRETHAASRLEVHDLQGWLLVPRR